MFGQSLLSGAFGIACTTDTDQLFTEELQAKTAATLQLNGNTNSLDIAGKFGGCANFNGSNSSIILPQNTGFDLNGAGSFSIWVNRNTTNQEWIFEKANGGSGTYGWQLFFVSGQYTFQMHNTINGVVTIYSGTSVNINTWEHIVVTHNGSNVFKMYLNGVLKDTSTLSGTVSVNTNGARFGEYAGGGYSFDGEIDQTRFFNTTLTASQVSDLYNEPTSTASTLNYPTTALALYQLNGNATDTSGNYDGSSSNITWAYNGTAVNPAYTTGKFGQAYDFSANGTGTIATGTSSYITFADDMSRANNFSWSFWIKSTGTPSNYPTLVSFYGAYINYIYFSPNIATMYLAFSDGADTTFSTGLTSLSNWTHFAFTKSSTSGRKFYINGTSVFSDNTTADAGAAPRTGHAIGMHWAS